jgi:uncharacterized Rossmann fold enzyme
LLKEDYDIDPVFWSGEYQKISSTLGIDPASERRAAGEAHELYRSRRRQIEDLLVGLEKMIAGKPVVVFGCGPSLDSQISALGTRLKETTAVLITADGATSALVETGIIPQVIVTDLDGYLPDIIRASQKGALVILHFHGDNRKTVARYAPDLVNVIPVTQTEPTEIVRNFGGFTDGDKCLFLSSTFGASAVLLVGMDFGTDIGPRSKPRRNEVPKKLRKLSIGRHLCEELINRSSARVFSLQPSPFPGVEEVDISSASKFLGGTYP